MLRNPSIDAPIIDIAIVDDTRNGDWVICDFVFSVRVIATGFTSADDAAQWIAMHPLTPVAWRLRPGVYQFDDNGRLIPQEISHG